MRDRAAIEGGSLARRDASSDRGGAASGTATEAIELAPIYFFEFFEPVG